MDMLRRLVSCRIIIIIIIIIPKQPNYGTQQKHKPNMSNDCCYKNISNYKSRVCEQHRFNVAFDTQLAVEKLTASAKL